MNKNIYTECEFHNQCETETKFKKGIRISSNKK